MPKIAQISIFPKAWRERQRKNNATSGNGLKDGFDLSNVFKAKKYVSRKLRMKSIWLQREAEIFRPPIWSSIDGLARLSSLKVK